MELATQVQSLVEVVSISFHATALGIDMNLFSLSYVKCNQPLPGFELVLPCPLHMTITIKSQAPPKIFKIGLVSHPASGGGSVG